jgi:signal transduction histidine kinase
VGHPADADRHSLAERVLSLTGRSRNRYWVIDVVLTAAWLGVGVLHLLVPDWGLWEDTAGTVYRSPGVLAWLLTFAMCLPILWGRRHPVAAFTVSWSALLALVVSDHLVGLMPFVEWILIYGVGAYSTRRRSVGVLGFMILGLVAASASDYQGFNSADVVRNVLVLTACLQFGRFAAASRRNARTKVELAEQRALLAAQQAQHAVVEERLSLAQELHDIVAHSISIITVQASMGSAAFDTQPHQTRRALANIERTSRDTLAELRGLLGVLRRDDGSRGARNPAPSLRDVPALVANVESAGIAATVVSNGPLALPAGVDAFAYRIVQEALTNVIKHAHATKVTIEIADSGAVASVRVRDDGRGHSYQTSTGGNGIIGMRERVATFGGTLNAGPAPGGGFEVHATLPYGSSIPTEVSA